MRRRPAAVTLAILVALTTLALKQQHASLPTLGVANQAAVEDILSAVAPTVQLVIVLISAEGREDVVRSGRPWRKGVPTYIFSNNNSTISQAEADEHGEHWLAYPDNDLKFTWKAGDFRAAVAPFLTYELTGSTFDWLLYGDDDTIFFAHGTSQLLADFDAGMPYIITDWLWAFSWDATLRNMAPRCLPCHAQHLVNCTGELQRDHFQPPVGCPCTPQLMCTALKADRDATIQTFVDGMCDGDAARPAFQYPETWERVYAVHGGAGAIISVTLLEAVTTSQIEACTIALCNERRQTGGDGIMATCLWEAGFAVTDPGDAICSEDWAPNKLFGGGEYSFGITVRQWLRNALNATDASPCKLADIRPGECEFQEAYLQRMVSTHLGAYTVFNNLTELSTCMEDIAADYAQLMLSQGLAASFGR